MLKYFKSWFDFKTKLKHIFRSLAYMTLVRKLIAYIIYFYLNLVFYTSKVKIVGFEDVLEIAAQKKPIILAFWHNRLVLCPFIGRYIIRATNYKFATLSSRHGDGQFIGELMQLFGFYSISGSTRDGRSADRGITLSSMREIIKFLRRGNGLGITPDGPKGPNQQVNGQLIEVAKLTHSNIVTISYSSSKMKVANSWDRLKIPLPFAKIVIYCSAVFSSEQLQGNIEEVKLKVKDKMDIAQNKADSIIFT